MEGVPDKPWEKKVRVTKTLLIRNNAEVGQWSGIVAQSVQIFNEKIMKAMKYELVSEGKAHVVVKIAGSGKHDPVFGNSALHGKTESGDGGAGLVEVEIFVPAQVTESHTNVLLHIMMHEMTHAAGLQDHADDGIFITVPNIQNGIITSTKYSKKMPPFFFSNKTILRMRKIW